MSRSQRVVDRHRTRWIDQGDHVVVRTPGNVTFYGGNQVLLPGPPAQPLPDLEALFAIAHPEAEHRSFEWQGGPPVEPERLEETGYLLSTSVLLGASSPRLDLPIDTDLVVEQVRSDAQWHALLTFWLDEYPDHGFSFHARTAADLRERPGAGDTWVARAVDGRHRLPGLVLRGCISRSGSRRCTCRPRRCGFRGWGRWVVGGLRSGPRAWS